MRHVEWLGATSIHSKDPWFERTCASMVALLDNFLQLGLVVNLFDEPAVDAPSIVSHALRPHAERVEGTNVRALATPPTAHPRARPCPRLPRPTPIAAQVPGMKTLFWKRVLTPERTRQLRVVWLFDCDIAVHPAVFPLGQLVGALGATRATLMQPSIRALVHGTYHTWLRVKSVHMSCLATTAQWVEMQTPLFSGDAWAAYNERVLGAISDASLANSDFGIDVSWCAAVRDLFPRRPACLVTPAEAATHLNSHSIEKFISANYSLHGLSKTHHTRMCHGTCNTIMKTFPQYWKNFSHHTGKCYGLSSHTMARGLAYEGRIASFDNDGRWHARRDPMRARNESADEMGEEGMAAVTILGATSMSFRHEVRRRELVSDPPPARPPPSAAYAAPRPPHRPRRWSRSSARRPTCESRSTTTTAGRRSRSGSGKRRSSTASRRATSLARARCSGGGCSDRPTSRPRLGRCGSSTRLWRRTLRSTRSDSSSS